MNTAALQASMKDFLSVYVADHDRSEAALVLNALILMAQQVAREEKASTDPQ